MIRIDRTTFPGTTMLCGKNNAWIFCRTRSFCFRFGRSEKLCCRRQYQLALGWIWIEKSPWEFWG